jgi:hypothetical protein
MILIAAVRTVRDRRRKEIASQAAVAGAGYADRYRPK